MSSNDAKISAAREACKYVEQGMRLGIGTGSTAEAFIHLLAEKIRSGLAVTGVPTSERTAALCRSLNVPLTDLDATPELDLTVDGTDEVDRQLRLIKGGGGALLREKIVAAASAQMLVIADGSKLVDDLGQFPLPIEVNLFGLKATGLAIEKCARELGLSARIRLRLTGRGAGGPANPGGAGACYLTDGGHAILDASFGRIPDPESLAFALNAVPGVVEHGLFIGLASAAIVADEEGVHRLQASPSTETST